MLILISLQNDIFYGNCSVTEIIPHQRLRYPVYDLDTRDIELHDIVCYFRSLFDCPRDKIYVFITNSGYHVLIKHCLVTFDENKKLLIRVSIDKPNWNTDLRAGLHSIKLNQTKSYKPGKETTLKTIIYGEFKLPSESLVCPTLIQEQITFIGFDNDDDKITIFRGSFDGTSLNEHLIRRISIALTGELNQITDIIETRGDMVILDRRPGQFCKNCQRRHGYDEFTKTKESTCRRCYVMCYSDTLYIGCFRAAAYDKKGKRYELDFQMMI